MFTGLLPNTNKCIIKNYNSMFAKNCSKTTYLFYLLFAVEKEVSTRYVDICHYTCLKLLSCLPTKY